MFFKREYLKDNFLLKDCFIKNTSLLTKYQNPCTGIKYTTIEYNNMLKNYIMLVQESQERKVEEAILNIIHSPNFI